MLALAESVEQIENCGTGVNLCPPQPGCSNRVLIAPDKRDCTCTRDSRDLDNLYTTPGNRRPIVFCAQKGVKSVSHESQEFVPVTKLPFLEMVLGKATRGSHEDLYKTLRNGQDRLAKDRSSSSILQFFLAHVALADSLETFKSRRELPIQPAQGQRGTTSSYTRDHWSVPPHARTSPVNTL